MTLPSDYARCRGDGADECAGCDRRLTALAEQADPPRWPAWWMVPPLTVPCPERIATVKETSE